MLTANPNLNIPAVGLDIPVVQAPKFYGVKTLAEAADILMNTPDKPGECSKCQVRSILMAELFPHPGVEKKIRFLQAHTVRNGKTGELMFAAVAGQVDVMHSKHPIFFALLPTVHAHIIEEVF